MKNKPWITYLFIGFVGYAKTHLLLHLANRVFPKILESSLITSYACFSFAYFIGGVVIGSFFKNKIKKASIAYFSFIIMVCLFGLYLNKYSFPLKVPGLLLFAIIGYVTGLVLAMPYYSFSKKLLMLSCTIGLFLLANFYIPIISYYNNFSRRYDYQRVFPANYTFIDMQGRPYGQDFFKGKAVLIEYWTTNCGACVDKFAYADKITQNIVENKEKVVILALNAGFRENIDDFRKFLIKHQTKYPNMTFLMDTANHTAKELNIKGFPYEIILDKNGKIRDELAGFDIQYKSLYIEDRSKILQALVNEK